MSETPRCDAERVDGYRTSGEVNYYRDGWPDAFLAGAHYALDRLVGDLRRDGLVSLSAVDWRASLTLARVKNRDEALS